MYYDTWLGEKNQYKSFFSSTDNWKFWNSILFAGYDYILTFSPLVTPVFWKNIHYILPSHSCNIFSPNFTHGNYPKEASHHLQTLKYMFWHLQVSKLLTESQVICIKGLICCSNLSATNSTFHEGVEENSQQFLI